jgi:peptide/nickel transport system substrate-binding protein
MAVLTACGGAQQPVAEAPVGEATEAPAESGEAESGEAESGEAAAPTQYAQAPMLDELVASGDLPPVDERLPAEPVVVEPVDEIGTYGGTLRFAVVETNLQNFTRLREAGLFRYNFRNTEVEPHLAKSFEFSDDLKTLRIELREGHKWSDGQPFTVDDIIFRYEDVTSNPELSPAFNNFWAPGGERAVFTKVSDTVLEITFAVPYPTVLDLLGRSIFSTDPNFLMPKHYLEKWHIDYNPDANELAEEEGFESWTEAFLAHANPVGAMEIGRPTIWAWMPEQSTTDRAVVVRNPYYPEVDTAGNQLPYIDRIDVSVTGNKEVQILKASSGELDFEGWYLSLAEMPVLQQNAEQGNYEVITASSLRTSEFALMPNHNTPDELLNELFNSLEFRTAMSLGIDREAINEVVFFGLARPFPALPLPYNSFFKPEWETMFVEHNPEEANAILDGLGLTEKDSEGFRLRPDNGERLSLLIEIGSQEGPKIEICELVVSQWIEIGLEGVCRVTEGSLFTQRNLGNEMIIPTWHLDRAGLFGRADPLWFAFTNPSQQRWAPMWATWYASGGAEGIEPPQEIKDMQDVFNRWQQTLPDSPEFIELGGQYYQWMAENAHMIGTVGLGPVPLLISNRLHNVQKEDVWWGSDHNFYAPFQPAQWYISE